MSAQASLVFISQVSRLAFNMENIDIVTWSRRWRHRVAAIAAIRQTREYRYTVCSAWLRTDGSVPLEPNPFDTNVSKRCWERSVQRWRNELVDLYENEK